MRTGRILIAVLSAMLLITGAAWCLLVYQGYRKGRVGYQDLADAFTGKRAPAAGGRQENPQDGAPGYGRPVKGSSDKTESLLSVETESEVDAKRAKKKA